jgi:hypothetical protein
LVSSRLLLIAAEDGERGEGWVVLNYFGSSVKVYLWPCEGKSYYYYDTQQTMNHISADVYLMLTRHYTSDYLSQYGSLDWKEAVFDGYDYHSTSAVKMVKRDLISEEWLLSLQVSKVSSQHHIHYNAHELWHSLTSSEQAMAASAKLLPNDATTSAVAGFMLWLASAKQGLVTYIIKSGLLSGPSMADVIANLKKLSVRAKSLQNIVTIDLRDIFELEVLSNRSYGVVDWEGEMKNRTEVDVVRISPREVYDKALEIFTRPDATKEKPRKLEWKQFYDMRWQWAASGSIHSQYDADKENLPNDYKLRTKFVALISGPDQPIQHYLYRAPQLQAWASYKYEWAKMRAIYGTDLSSYVLAHFAFYNCEATLPNEFPVGPKANDEYVCGKLASVMENATQFCIDFSDFNSQHSTSSMQAVIDAYITAHQQDLSTDQMKAMWWTRQSLDDVVVHDNMGLKRSYKAAGTLLSGWRLTTFMNSVLNKVYTAKLLGSKMLERRAVHNGDDVIAGVRSFGDVITVLNNARKFNIRLQASKCAVAGIAEFLRVDHVRGSTGQYLARNISTVVHSRVETQFATDWTAIVGSHEDRLKEFVTRGGSVTIAARLRHTFYKKMADEYQQPVEDFYIVRETHRIQGGVSEERSASFAHRITRTTSSEGSALSGRLPGVDSYAKHIAKSLAMSDDKIKTIRERISLATAKATSYTRHSVKIVLDSEWQKRQLYLGIYKVNRAINKASMFGKAKMVGMILDIDPKDPALRRVQRMAKASADPMTYVALTT